MHRPVLLVLIAATLGAAAPGLAQDPSDQARWDQARARFDRETAIFQAERQRWEAAQGRLDNRPLGDGRDFDDRPFATDYDAAGDYRDGPRYRERVLASDDQVYRGSDGRFYCQRNDGTTGLIIGGALGGVFGNVVDGGRRRTAGTLLGGALGAILGRSAEQRNDVRCR